MLACAGLSAFGATLAVVSDVTAILDSIDGTLSDYSVSADAMRWAPEASGPAVAAGDAQAAEAAFLEAFGPVLAWATEACRLIADLGKAMAERLTPVFRSVAATLAAIGEADRERARRGAAMRREYRRRQLARRRRRGR